jgi:peptidoglycan/LPS O-acetylase OafA/YrhL
MAQKLHLLRVNIERKPYDNFLVLLDVRGGAFMFSETKYRRDIQVLRGLAVLAVVLFHAKENYFPLGYLGVDVFFVISGFVVTPLILRIFTDQANRGGRLSSLKHFYRRRFYRLAPALVVTLSISAVTIFLLGPIADHQRFARQGIATLLLAGNVGAYRYSGDYFSPNPNPLVHTWSLSVEEQIYIFLPLILMLILHKRRSLKKITAVALGVISALSFVSFLFPTILEPLYSRAGIEIASQFSFYSPIDRIWQFTLGGLAFLLLDLDQNRAKKIPKGIHLLTVIAVVMILFGPLHMNIKGSSALASFIAVIVIVLRSLAVLPEILTEKLEWLGDRSYSIYLVHMPLIYIAKYSPVTQMGSGENRIIQSTIAVVASILLGSLSFSKIENRFRNNSNKGSTASSGILKVFVSVFIGPLTIFLLLSGFLGTSSTPMDKDRSDNGLCKFWTPSLDGNFHSRFLKCYSKFGGATVVLGDSHAMNIYNSLFLTTRSDFFVGISTGGCRPNTQSDSCPYDDFERFLKSSPNSIKQVIFHQSGSYLISDKRGQVDSNLAFKSQDSYRILDDDIQFLIRYLKSMGRHVATTWIGPFPELRVEPTWIQVKANQVKPNPIVKRVFLDLEKQIIFYLKEENHTFRYVSLSGLLGYRQFEYKVESCILFRDIDHWSTCGEEMFSLPINKSLQD